MSSIGALLTIANIVFAGIIAVYFLGLLRSQKSTKTAIHKESCKELDKLRQLRSVSLTVPLAEKTRPKSFEDIIGQQEGIKLLRAALCGPNPQHVIIYGPPGVGKTAAARLVLEDAKKNPDSPFGENAKFVELDATTARFDERGIADPLIGTVHDPIYQGAGSLGIAGIPQPKPGAVTKAHGGILFIDEIGELHPIQMNKLLKVLEDRKVFLESAYYSPEDPNIPEHIHSIFQEGLPADFRMVGATTRRPEDIPPAIRSRCLEIFFRELTPAEIAAIAERACARINMNISAAAVEIITHYARNGREAVNMIQIAAGLAQTENRIELRAADIEWVVNSTHAVPRLQPRIPAAPQIGVVNGLAVYGANLGTLVEIEAVAKPVKERAGELRVTGVIDEEEFGGSGRRMRRQSSARDSVENVLSALKTICGIDPRQYDIHINFPGGMPLDGPSAGIAIATAVYSAITSTPVDNRVALTGELSLRGTVKPVGGIAAKLAAAEQTGVEKVLIPKDNWQTTLAARERLKVVPVATLEEVLSHALIKRSRQLTATSAY